jgi:alanine racemase
MRHHTYLEVNLGHLASNLGLIRDLAPRARLLPMVKADAYGNGMVPVSQFLVRDLGVRDLGCATLGEALKLLDDCPDLAARVLIFSDSELQDEKLAQTYLNYNIVPVLHNRQDLELVLTRPEFRKLPLVLKLNTGMNRLGLLEADLLATLPRLRNRGVHHLMTHFARASIPLEADDLTARQYAEFGRLRKLLLDAGVAVEETSVSNSGAIEQRFGVDETFVRPGLMLYGPPSVLEPVRWTGAQVSRWVTRVLATFEVKRGTPVGYGMNVADRDSYFAILPVGYGDGFLTFYSGLELALNGVRGRVFGRVNMDMAYVQFDPDQRDKPRVNDVVEIWNHDHRLITDLAVQAKTHAYQVMCAVTNRVPRIYKAS